MTHRGSTHVDRLNWRRKLFGFTGSRADYLWRGIDRCRKRLEDRFVTLTTVGHGVFRLVYSVKFKFTTEMSYSPVNYR